MKKLLIASLCFYCSLTVGQNKANTLLTRIAALEDLKVLETSLFEIHPSIFRYTTKTEFKKEFEAVRNAIKPNVTVMEFSNLIAPIIANIHCGHSFTVLPYVEDSKGLLPLDVKIDQGKLFVLSNYSPKEKLPVGSEILEINDTPAADLLKNFESKASADGYGLTFKERTVEKYFRGKYAAYIGQPDSFKIKFKRDRIDHQQFVKVGARTYQSIAQAARDMGIKQEKPLDFHIDKNNNVAILKLRSFIAKSLRKQNGQNINKVIKKSFKEIGRNHVGNLIIDIRSNTGGKTSIPPLLYSYLTDKKFNFKRKLIFRHGYRFSYHQYMTRNKFNDWVNRKLDKKINDSTYEWTLHRNTKSYRPKRDPFKGKVYVLINGMTASAGTEFASLVYANGRGIFIGEESGGDYNGVNGLDRTYLQLPNSKIGLIIAGWRSIMAWDEKEFIGHGITPNYEVHPTVDDLIAGRDNELELVYLLIGK